MSGCGDKCSCENLTTYEPCGENLTCCEHCPDGAPCAYAIITKCRWKKNGLFLNGITPLWKECLFECKWTARRCISHDADCLTSLGVPLQYDISGGDADFLLGCGEDGEGSIGLAFPSLGDLYPPIGDAATDHGDSVTQISPPVALDGTDYVATRLKFECDRIPGNPNIIPYRCGWFDWYGRDAQCGIDFEAWLNTCTAIAWELQVTGTESATLTAWQSAGDDATVELVATYNCNNWQCIPEFAAEDKTSHGNTFIMDGDAAVGFEAYLPRKLCVVPYSADWQTHCSSKAAACACYDNGAESACLDVNLGDCGGEQTVTITRNATLPTGVTDPSAPCGYFWGTITGLCDGITFGVITYCDGADYHVDLWCDSGSGWTEIDTATATLTDTCPGAAYTWTWSGDWGDCCCPDEIIPETPCCGDNPLPSTIYADITVTGCTGVTATLNATGGATFSGAVTIGACSATITATMDDLGGGSCGWTVTITTADGTCFTASGVAANPCLVIPVNRSGTWSNPPCSCCTGGGSVSVDLYR